jgi:hypothetical protein
MTEWPLAIIYNNDNITQMKKGVQEDPWNDGKILFCNIHDSLNKPNTAMHNNEG